MRNSIIFFLFISCLNTNVKEEKNISNSMSNTSISLPFAYNEEILDSLHSESKFYDKLSKFSQISENEMNEKPDSLFYNYVDPFFKNYSFSNYYLLYDLPKKNNNDVQILYNVGKNNLDDKTNSFLLIVKNRQGKIIDKKTIFFSGTGLDGINTYSAFKISKDYNITTKKYTQFEDELDVETLEYYIDNGGNIVNK